MMDNNLQQSLRELRSHRKLPEREGEYWSDEERENLSQKFRRSRSHCIAVNRQLCSRLKSSIYLTARRIRGVSVPQDS